MPYMTSTERMLAEKYRQEGWQEAHRATMRKSIAAMLEVRFGSAGLALLPLLEAVTNAEQLEAAFEAAKTAPSVVDVRRLLG